MRKAVRSKGGIDALYIALASCGILHWLADAGDFT